MLKIVLMLSMLFPAITAKEAREKAQVVLQQRRLIIQLESAIEEEANRGRFELKTFAIGYTKETVDDAIKQLQNKEFTAEITKIHKIANKDYYDITISWK